MGLKEAIESGNFSKAGEIFRNMLSSRDKNVRSNLLKEVDILFSSMKEDINNFFEWDPKRMLKNAFILAAKTVTSKLKTTQIRKILSLSKSIAMKKEENILPEIAKMRYLLAYSASRHREVVPLMEVFDPILNQTDKENFEKVYEFLQAVVAYHRFLGGREG